MADETPPRQMSLIPYPHRNGEIVLRRGNAVVVYDADSQLLSAHNDTDQALEVTKCPVCHRPMREDFVEGVADGEVPPSSTLDPEYFALLAASRRASPTGSPGPATPRNSRFTQPALRSGRSRDVSGTQDPPSGAEFLSSEPSAAGRQGISRSAVSTGLFKQFFVELKILGKGGHGVVLLVEHVIDGVPLGQLACKRIPVGDDHAWLEKVLLEVKMLIKVPHRNLVPYKWVWLEDYRPSKFGPKIPHLWILQEYCNGGDLHSYVVGSDNEGPTTAERLKEKMRRKSRADTDRPGDLRGPSKLTFDEIFSFFKDIASGLHHLHKKNYIHRDLKPSNCLLQHDGNQTKVLISDFGEVQAAGAKRGSTGATGTISYCAPEVLRQDAADGGFGEFTTKSDIFSLGMIVYFMCFGRLPYRSADDVNEENEDLDELREEIARWSGLDDQTRPRPDLPETLYRYLKRLLSVDPHDRPSTDDIMTDISRGAGLGDIVSPFVEENSSRISPIDSPDHRPSPPGRKQSTNTSRPGLSSLRQMSVDTIRARSPPDHSREGPRQDLSRSHSRPTSPGDGSIIKRPSREIDRPSSRHEQSPMPKSPRLMLPAPPERSLLGKTLERMRTPEILMGFRAALFLAKVLSLLLPCTPYTANVWLLYPLLGLATLDMLLPTVEVRRTSFLLSVHVILLMLAIQRGRLCQRHNFELMYDT